MRNSFIYKTLLSIVFVAVTVLCNTGCTYPDGQAKPNSMHLIKAIDKDSNVVTILDPMNKLLEVKPGQMIPGKLTENYGWIVDYQYSTRTEESLPIQVSGAFEEYQIFKVIKNYPYNP